MARFGKRDGGLPSITPGFQHMCMAALGVAHKWILRN
jgi:hypothetical protein